MINSKIIKINYSLKIRNFKQKIKNQNKKAKKQKRIIIYDKKKKKL